MAAILIGLLFIFLGGSGIVYWAPEFFVFVKGFFPLSLALGGLISIIIGLSSFRRRDDGPKSDK